jgi:hypothetical protein
MTGREPKGVASAEAVADATDPKRRLSATPSTPIGDVDGVADRSADLLLA